MVSTVHEIVLRASFLQVNLPPGQGQILMKYREIYAFCTVISISYLHSFEFFYKGDFTVSLIFLKNRKSPVK